MTYDTASGRIFWTMFDPHGLKVKVKTETKKDDDGNEVKHTKIDLTAKVRFTGDSAKWSKKKQEKMRDRIEEGIKDRFKLDDKDHKVEVSVKLDIAQSDSVISEDDHVFYVVDQAHEKDSRVAGITPLGGKWVKLDKDFMTQPGKLEKNSAHELGHSFGLHHPHPEDPNNNQKEREGKGVSKKNPLRNLEKSNIMRYFGDKSTINKEQAELMQKLYNEGHLNKWTNDPKIK